MAIKRIMQYLNGTSNMRLRIGRKHINQKNYFDADGATIWKIVGFIYGYIFFDGKMLCHGIKNDINEGGGHGNEPMHDGGHLAYKQMEDACSIRYEAMTIMCNNQASMALAKSPPTTLG